MQKWATITSKGQITVPREIRRRLGVRSGDKLLFESDSQGVRVRAIRNRSSFSKYRGFGNPEIPCGRKNIRVAARHEGRMTTAIDTNAAGTARMGPRFKHCDRAQGPDGESS